MELSEHKVVGIEMHMPAYEYWRKMKYRSIGLLLSPDCNITKEDLKNKIFFIRSPIEKTDDNNI